MGEYVEEMKNILPEPEGFREWMSSNMKPEPIFYKNYKNRADCTCGRCRLDYTVRWHDRANETFEQAMAGRDDEKPVRHNWTECKMCGHRGPYEWQKVTAPHWEYKSFFLLQRTAENGLVMRVYRYRRTVQQGFKTDERIYEERRYVALETGAQVWRVYVDYLFRKTAVFERMQRGSVDWKYGGLLFPGWEDEIGRSDFKYFNMEDYGGLPYDPNRHALCIAMALMAYANNPAIEMFSKMGLGDIVEALIQNMGINALIYRKGKTLQAQLRLKDKRNINRLKEHKGSVHLLKIMQYEEKHGYKWNREQEQWILRIINYWDSFERIKMMLKYMTLQQLINRCEKYGKQLHSYSQRDVLVKYSDYIRMRGELEYDMTNEVFLHPKNLMEKHDEMVREQNARKDELLIKKKNKEFSKIGEKYGSLTKKYSYEAEGLVVRPARDAGEIIMEGRILHHCVGGDRYLRSHNEGNSAILFLRKEKKPEKPYITIEIRGERIVQWYGLNDKKPDKERIDLFLKGYTAQIGKKTKRQMKEAV